MWTNRAMSRIICAASLSTNQLYILRARAPLCLTSARESFHLASLVGGMNPPERNAPLHGRKLNKATNVAGKLIFHLVGRRHRQVEASTPACQRRAQPPPVVRTQPRGWEKPGGGALYAVGPTAARTRDSEHDSSRRPPAAASR